MQRMLRAAIMALAGVFAVGTVSVGQAVAAPSDDDRYATRELAVSHVVAADDDDDDDDDNSRTGATSGVDSKDGTNSRHTDVSRDRDRSRGDLTRDFTRDGGDRTRDWSRHHTNDPSRNDTR